MRQGLTTKYQPKKLKDFIGLRTPKAIMGKLVADPYDSAFLFVGASGCGKTTLAFAVAAEMKAEVHHVASSKCTKESVDDLIGKCWYRPMFGERHCPIIDEADLMSTAAQNAFLSILDGSGSFPPETTFFFTTNNTAKLEARFQSRCRVLQFDESVDVGDLGGFLYDVWFEMAPSWATAPLMHKILAEAKGNVRAGLMALENELDMIPDRKVA